MKAPLNGLVLAGGKSSRMGEDKAFINWHGKAQCYHLADILKELCGPVYISCNRNQQGIIDQRYSFLVDHYEEAGPMGGLLSAFETSNSCAWLVIACDHPLIDREAIKYLIDHRDTSCMATAFCNAEGFPEPLIAIWEPAAFEILAKAFKGGAYAPQKILRDNTVRLVTPKDPRALVNVNTKEDASIAAGLSQRR